jgi:short-subunit dehydrogenase
VRRGVDLDSSVVVITGASSGIGRAAARRFARKGADLVLAARSDESLRDAVAECEAAGARAIAVPTDVADAEATEALARRAVEEFGRIDVWVNDAAVMAFGAIGEVPADVQRRVIETNLLGSMHGARAVLPTMREQGHGVIVNVASLYAKMTSPYVSAYATSKFGILGFSQVLRQELQTDPGIHVTTVLPGSTDTPIFRHAANYTGRRVSPIPPVSSPERAARAVVRSAERPRRRRTVGRVQHLATLGHALAPRTYTKVVPYAMRLVALGKEPSPHHSGNVFDPLPELDAVSGGWRSGSLRLSAGAGVLTLAAAGFVVRRWTQARARGLGVVTARRRRAARASGGDAGARRLGPASGRGTARAVFRRCG